ncbi:MAG: hypothetical protein ACTSU5_03475 [Promethearchaeota archaeon]
MDERVFSCPFCHEWIGEPALICPSCGREIEWDPVLLKEGGGSLPGERARSTGGRIRQVATKFKKFFSGKG